MTTTTWAAGRCRNCRRPNATRSEELGIPGWYGLDSSGKCPSCGIAPPPVDECEVCGGIASRGEYYDALGVTMPPDVPPESATLALILSELEVEPDPERGFLPRRELGRIMRKLYGRRTSRRRTYQRRLLRTLIGNHYAGQTMGRQLAEVEAHEKLPGAK